MSLLEEAKKIKTQYRLKNDFTEEEIELVLSYLKEEVATNQICKVLKFKNPGSVTNYVLQAIRSAYKRGKLKIV
jgi:NADPH-dependent 7-cyano-7-deazaguanine reductase QueF